MEPYKADLVADAAYPANANTDANAEAGADANADSAAATAPNAAVTAAALITLAASSPAAVPNITSIMNQFCLRGVLKHIDRSETLCSQSVWFQLNGAGKEDCYFDIDKDRSAMEMGNPMEP
jgi:hypothetical protein